MNRVTLLLALVAIAYSLHAETARYRVLDNPPRMIMWKGAETGYQWAPLNKGDRLYETDSIDIEELSCLVVEDLKVKKGYPLSKAGKDQIQHLVAYVSSRTIGKFALELAAVYRSLLEGNPVPTSGAVVYKEASILPTICKQLVKISSQDKPQNMSNVLRSLPQQRDTTLSLVYYDKYSGEEVASFFDAKDIGIGIRNNSDTALYVCIYDIKPDTIRLLPRFEGTLVPANTLIQIETISLRSAGFVNDSLLLIAYPLPFDSKELLIQRPLFDEENDSIQSTYHTKFCNILL